VVDALDWYVPAICSLSRNLPPCLYRPPRFEGLKAAVTKVLSATWQRCRVHFMRNVLAHAGKSGRRVVSAFIATAFAQETPEAASAQWRAVADQIRPKVPKLGAILDDAEPDVLAYMTFPKEHRAKLHSTDKIDKLPASECGNLARRGRPRGEARCIGWKRRQAATNTSSRLIMCIGLPAPSCSRCLCPGWSHHTPWTRDPQPDFGTRNLIPVTNVFLPACARATVAGAASAAAATAAPPRNCRLLAPNPVRFVTS